MIRSGLVSITFRPLDPRAVIRLAVETGLEGIEWGGDVHVPHGDVARAREVARMTSDAGCRVASYGSYYIVGHDEPAPFGKVLDTACALGAPTIRVWAGRKGSADADADYWRTVVNETRRIADLAQRSGVVVAFEFHGGSLADTARTAARLMKEAGHPNARQYWQPAELSSVAERVAGLKLLHTWLANLHVYHWTAEGRLSLLKGETEWMEYLRSAAGERYALLEFMPNDDPACLPAESAALKDWLGRLQNPAQP